MNLLRALLAPLVLIVLPLDAAIADEACPTGAFPVDAREIAQSFAHPGHPDSADSFGSGAYTPAEIRRIHDGVVAWSAGAFVNDGLQAWTAYDADRHLFLNAQGFGGQFAVNAERVKLGPGQTFHREGKWGFKVTTVRATREQARRFGCLANNLLNSPLPHPDPGFAMGPTDTLAVTHSILKDGRSLRFGQSTDPVFKWVTLVMTEPLLKAEGTWVTPHVYKLAADAGDNLYLLLNPGSIRSPRIDVVRITPSGRVTHLSARTPKEETGMYIAVDQAGRVIIPAFGGAVLYELPPGVTVPAAVTQRQIHLEQTGLFKHAIYLSPLALDRDDNVYSLPDSRLVRVTPGGSVTALAGDGAQGDVDGVGAAASLYFPCELAVAPNGDVFATDEHNSIIRKVTQTGTVTTLAGRAGAVGLDDGMGEAARFQHPQGIAIDRQGVIFVADTGNHVIRRITPLGQVTTLAGLATVRGHTDGKGLKALLDSPASIAVDSHGVLYVTNGHDNLVRRISPDGEVSTLNVQKWIPPVDIDSLL
jgi:hypothetical protein